MWTGFRRIGNLYSLFFILLLRSRHALRLPLLSSISEMRSGGVACRSGCRWDLGNLGVFHHPHWHILYGVHSVQCTHLPGRAEVCIRPMWKAEAAVLQSFVAVDGSFHRPSHTDRAPGAALHAAGKEISRNERAFFRALRVCESATANAA